MGTASAVQTQRIAAPATVPATAARADVDAVACPAAATLPFELCNSDEALLRAWRKLESAASLPTQSQAFAAALANALRDEADFEIAVARDGDGIAALLPLCRGKKPFARWAMIGAPYEPGDVLCRNRETVRLLAEAVASKGRILDLDRIPAGSLLIQAVRTAMRGKGWVSVRPADPTPTIALDSGWRDPASRFNPGRRSDFRRAARRAEEYGEVTFDVASPRPGEFDTLFDEAVAVEARSWKAHAGTAIAADGSKELFYREFFRSACAKGEFRIASMRIDGRAVATQLALESHDRYWLFKIGFDERFARCSPGTLLMLHTIGWAAARELRAYELLGKIEPWIAQLWTREQHDCVRLRTYPLSASGAAALAVDAAVWLYRRLFRRNR